MTLDTLVELEPLESKYSIGKVLGEGGFSVVRFGIDKETKKRVAIKYIKKEKAYDGMNLETEILAMSRLGNHANILSFYGLYQSPRHYIMVVEYMKGGHLLDLLVSKARSRTVPYSESGIALVLHQIVSAVAHCHKHHILHRDIKADNILLVSTDSQEHLDIKESSVRLADFGLALELDPLNLPIEGSGTIYYMAPERVRGDPYDEKSHFPFYGKTREDIIEAILNPSEPTYSNAFTGISDACMTLLRDGLLAKDPNQRPSATQLLSNPWLTGQSASTLEIKGAIEALRSFSLRKKFRGVIQAIVAGGRLKSILLALRKERLILELLDYNLSIEDFKQLVSAFQRQGWGKVMLDEKDFVRVVLDKLHLLSVDLANRLFDVFQVQGKINTRNFVLALVFRVGKTLQERMDMAFWLFDPDHSGTIDKVEYFDMIIFVHKSMGYSPPSLETLAHDFENRDSDGNNCITRDEFVTLISRHPLIVKYMKSIVRILAGRHEVFLTTLGKILNSRSGWVFVRYQGIFGWWKERYMVLDEANLIFYNDEDTSQLGLDTIPLMQALVTYYTNDYPPARADDKFDLSFQPGSPLSSFSELLGIVPGSGRRRRSSEGAEGGHPQTNQPAVSRRSLTPDLPTMSPSDSAPRTDYASLHSHHARAECPPRLSIETNGTSLWIETKTKDEIEMWVRLFEAIGVRIIRTPFIKGKSSPRVLVNRRNSMKHNLGQKMPIDLVHLPPTQQELDDLARKIRNSDIKDGI